MIHTAALGQRGVARLLSEGGCDVFVPYANYTLLVR